jgi:hypothetical protein
LLTGKAEATPASEALAVGGIVWRPGCTLASVLSLIILLEVWSVAVAKYVFVHQKYAFVQLH